jgi:hypothetical protein
MVSSRASSHFHWSRRLSRPERYGRHRKYIVTTESDFGARPMFARYASFAPHAYARTRRRLTLGRFRAHRFVRYVG